MSRTARPAARVPQGVPVILETLDAFGNALRSEADLFSSAGEDCVNPATGPIFIEGAEAGDMLRVDILRIDLAAQGVVATMPGLGVMGGSVAEQTRLVSIKDGQAHFAWKTAPGALHRALPLKPMVGVIGVAPAGSDELTDWPGSHGGNLDCKHMIEGASLYLPVAVPGALFAAGDLHALMGDGEVGITGVEMAGELTVRFTVSKGKQWPLPMLVAEGRLMTLASAETLDAAANLATRHMQEFLVQELGFDPTEAAMLLSVEGNLRICQVVNLRKTARLELPLEILDQCGYVLP